MPLPVVAIVGRPNVGKSSLFNWLARRRIAIVDATAGVTRDRVSTGVELDGRAVDLVDTGGVGIQDIDDLTADVEKQIQHAINQADVVLFVVDGRQGVAPLDEVVAERLRGLNKPVLLVANKCDSPELDIQTTDHFRLGYGTPLCVSAQQNRGRDELARAVRKQLPPDTGDARVAPSLLLAIVGRRNTGKSTFINWLCKEERMIVSEVPGTTRDSVDVRFAKDDKIYVAIDTAGVRKKKSLAGDIDFYSLVRAERSIRRADVVLHFMDPRLTISRVDKQLEEYILEQHKPAIFVINKWDLADGLKTGTFADYVHKMFPMLDFVPVAFVSARNGKNVGALLKLAEDLAAQAQARVGTGELNRVLKHALDAQAPPLRLNRRLKVYYATQVDVSPPTIVLFCNDPELMSNTYRRHILKTFRDQLPFGDVPVKLHVRQREHGVEGEAPPEQAGGAKRGARSAKRGAPSAERGARKPKAKKPTKPELWDV